MSGSRSRSGPPESLAEKGHSFLGYFVFSLFFPAALIVAYRVEDRAQSAVDQPPGVVRLP